ncbi:hypothetical protein CYLTODRAFT_433826 [Cylindrobasidium torrendii FP15055 ss-10]|uniref:STEEP1 domain-containing protein n=1 Tax=Cylindrobasidium torrendii FP15055 ss-10 TaxID=1314674 RepID=A0A0D7BU77_9AGAR|nr:hypothetical protein CYLTODRAFT_433826 [Cylindrobasidium torrendii FP15055 ss-10]
MPKVVSTATISSSDAHTNSSTANLRVYYCICGEFILVIDKALAALPVRPTDKSTVIPTKDGADAPVFKINATLEDEAVLIERENGHERQHKFLCPRCTLPVGYQSTPPPAKSGDYIYLLKGALTQMQGKLPPDAFDGENDL